MGFKDPITAGDILIRSAIQSPNYVPGTAGWTINQDGTAEFTGLQINQGSLYLYDNQPVLRLAIDAIPTPGIRIYDATADKRIELTGDAQGNLYFYSTNPGETAPARLRAYDQGGYGRLELVGPELGGNAAGRVQIDSQDIRVSSAVHSGSTFVESPVGGIHLDAHTDVTITADGDVVVSAPTGTATITADGNLILQTTGAGEIHADGNFVVDAPHVIHVGFSNFYADMGIHSGGKILLDAGSWIKRGGLAGATLQNGWTNFGGGYQNAAYVEYPDQTAGLVGVISAGNTAFGTTLLTIPAAIRPAANHVFLAAGSSGTIAQVAVAAGGAVTIQSLTGGTPTWISLSGCRWPMNGF